MLRKFQIDNFKLEPGVDQKKLADGQGLHLLVTRKGGKYWRFNYRFAGLFKTLALGTYPEVSIDMARALLADARKKLLAGIDPAKTRKEEKAASLQKARTFDVVSKEWRETKADKAAATVKKIDEGLELLNAELGDEPISELRTKHFVAALEKIEKRSTHMASKCRQYATSVVRYAIRKGDREEGAFVDLKDVLKPLKKKKFVSPIKVSERHKIQDITRAVFKYKEDNLISGSALHMLLLTFVRPIEVVSMRWEDIQKDGTEWKYVVSKSGASLQNHIVPLSTQAQKILADLKPVTGSDEFVFSSTLTSYGYICRDSLSAILRRLGFRGVIVPHGSRHFASTMLNEMKFRADVIEIQLSHRDSSIRGIYNEANWLPERIEMMQTWADFLDAEAKKKEEDCADF